MIPNLEENTEIGCSHISPKIGAKQRFQANLVATGNLIWPLFGWIIVHTSDFKMRCAFRGMKNMNNIQQQNGMEVNYIHDMKWIWKNTLNLRPKCITNYDGHLILPYTIGWCKPARITLSLSRGRFNRGQTPSRQKFQETPLKNLIQENNFHQELLGIDHRDRGGSSIGVWGTRFRQRKGKGMAYPTKTWRRIRRSPLVDARPVVAASKRLGGDGGLKGESALFGSFR